MILILAAGQAHRYNGKIKQLLPIGSTTIIGRIVAQCREHDHEPFIIAHELALLSESKFGLSPTNSATTCNSLLSTRDLWRGQMIVLLGDVYYSDDLIDRIIHHRGVRVWGCTAEIYALSFDEPSYDRVAVSLEAASKYRFGKLRYFYKHYCDLDMDCEERVGHPPENKVFHYVNDGVTQDVDSEREYLALLDKLAFLGMK